MNDVRSQLDEYFSYVGAVQGSVDVLDVVESVVPLPVESVPHRRSGRGGWLVAAAAAALVLLLVGGLGLLARVVNDSEDAPVVDDPVVTTTQPTITSTTVTDALDEPQTLLEETPIEGAGDPLVSTPWSIEDVPADTESGTLDTPLGPASWVRVPSDPDTVPGRSWGEAIVWPSGFALFLPPQWASEGVLPGQLWVSADGIEWRRESLPLDPSAEEASLTRDGDTYWLASLNPNTLWRSTDGTTWHEYDSAILNTSGRGWHTNGPMAAPVTAGDLTMSYANFSKFVSDANGDPNTIPDRLEERLYVIGESEITRIDVPWPTFSSVAQGFNHVTLYGSGGWVYAYVVNETSNASGQTESSNMTVWRTNDGASWADIGSPSFLSDLPVAGSVHFDMVAEMLVVTISSAYPESGRPPEAAAWESADGVNWVPMPSGRPGGTYPTRLESGWFASDGDKGGSYFGDTLWMQVSGTWVSLADMGMERLQPSDCWLHKTAVGTTTFFRSGGCPGGIASPVEQDILILSLPPAD